MSKMTTVFLAIFSASAILALNGCNATEVQVQSQNGNSPAAAAPVPQSPAGSSSGSSSSSSSNSGSSGPVSGSPKVFFERILTDGTQVDQLIAISFSSQDSQTTTPTGVALKTPENFSGTPIFAPVGDQVFYLQSNGLVSDSLVSTALGTLATQPLYDYPAQVVAMSFSSSQKTAWIDETGDVSVADLLSGESQTVSLPSGATAVSIQLSASGESLLAMTGANELLVYGFDQAQAQWTQSFSASSVTAAALGSHGQSGDRLAYVQNGKLYGVDLALSSTSGISGAGPSPVPVATLQSGTVYDFAWAQDSGSVVYWSPLSTTGETGEGEIRQVFVQPGALAASAEGELTLARVSVPSGVTNGVVCPAWAGNALYFGGFAQGEYQIERASLQSGLSGEGTKKDAGPALGQPVPFAAPPASDEGFICPILSKGSAQ